MSLNDFFYPSSKNDQVDSMIKEVAKYLCVLDRCTYTFIKGFRRSTHNTICLSQGLTLSTASLVFR